MTTAGMWSEGGAGTLDHDRGLLYGEGLFETILVRNGRPFRLAAHLDRLQVSARALHLPLPATGWQERLQAALRERAGALPSGAGRARVTLTAGPAPAMGDPAEAPTGPARLLLHVHPLAPLPAGHGALTARRAGPELAGGPHALSSYKTLAWLAPLLCLREARAAGADEGILVTRSGLLVGGARANLFVVRDGELFTPSLESGCLPGITRRIILEEVAPALDLACHERDLRFPEAFAGAHEAFLTNSLRGVMPLAEVLPAALDRPAGHKLTTRVKMTYEALVAKESGTE